MAPDPQTNAPEEERGRGEVLMQLEDWLERPMLVLSSIWLSLVAPAFRFLRALRLLRLIGLTKRCPTSAR